MVVVLTYLDWRISEAGSAPNNVYIYTERQEVIATRVGRLLPAQGTMSSQDGVVWALGSG